MSSELAEIDDTGVRAAFAEYGQEPGGEVRLDTAAISVAGRRRVLRQRVIAGAAGVATVVALVGAAATVQHFVGSDSTSPRDVVADKPGDMAGTGRNVTDLFGSIGDHPLDQPIRQGGDAEAMGRKFAAELDTAPRYLDAAWQADAGSPKPGMSWSLFTWTDGDKAAEGLLQVTTHPFYIAIYPPPYQSCGMGDTTGGRSCQVREVAGKGWLKVLRDDKTKELQVFLQRSGAAGEQVSVVLRGGAATHAKLAGGRAELGKLPVTEQDVVDAVLTVG
jgi:hypothetical protein